MTAVEPLGMQQGNSGLGAQRASATYETKLPALRRREEFARRHPDIDITARRENGQLRFYAREPGHPEPAAWTDLNAMLDDLETRHPAVSPIGPDPSEQQDE